MLPALVAVVGSIRGASVRHGVVRAAWGGACGLGQSVQSEVLHGESTKRLATPRNTKDKKHLQSNQSAQPTNLTDQAPSTTERTARETHNHQLTQQPCTLQHNNNPPSAPTPDRIITRSFQPTQPAAKPRSNTGGLAEQADWLRGRAGPHNTLDTTHLSGEKCKVR